MEQNIINMTICEFSNYLGELNREVTHYYEYEKTVKNTRPYINFKRGNFGARHDAKTT